MAALDPAVQTALETGDISFLDLVRFDFPSGSYGYHMGGRDYTWQGLVYHPNRFLSLGYDNSGLGVYVTTTTLYFSGVPIDDEEDAINKLETLDYVNAPVIVTRLFGRPGAQQPIGVLWSKFYEIDTVRYPESGVDETGVRRLNVEIDLEPPGRSARGITGVRRSTKEQQFDNDPTDTGLDYASTTRKVPVEWGQTRG